MMKLTHHTRHLPPFKLEWCELEYSIKSDDNKETGKLRQSICCYCCCLFIFINVLVVDVRMNILMLCYLLRVF